MARLFFTTLFGAPNQSFFELVECNRKAVPELILDEARAIVIYGERFACVEG